jgi:V8-like Glu-specific endopeptidase
MRATASYGTIATLLALVACQLPDTGPHVTTQDDEIINGTQSTSSDFPSTGALLHRHSCGFLGLSTCYDFVCSGVLIAPSVVLTAAHCVIGVSEIYFTLNLNAGSTTSSTRFSSAGEVANPSYNADAPVAEQGDHDLAIVRLSGAPGSAIAQLVTPAENAALAAGTPTMLAGYGATGLGVGGTGTKGVKFHGPASITALDQNKLFMSTYQQGAASCYGDSGGPAYITRAGARQANVIAGVVHGPDTEGGDRDCSQSARYARVAPDLMWIHQLVALPCDSGLPCSQRCGDFHCDSNFEDYLSCPSDCAPPPPVCGDGICSSGETCTGCPDDCGTCCPSGEVDCGGGMCCNPDCTICDPN